MLTGSPLILPFKEMLKQWKSQGDSPNAKLEEIEGRVKLKCNSHNSCDGVT